MRLTKEDRAMLREEYLKTWRDEGSADWAVGKVSGYIEFGNELVTYRKPTIETSFCFGEHGYDYDEVNEYCDERSRDMGWFVSENLRRTDAAWHLDMMRGTGRSFRKHRPVLVSDTNYGSRLASVEFMDDWSQELEDGRRDMTKEEREAFECFLEDEQEKFEKRLRSYLKRYGLSKCRYWTYWADR